jgi:hypothetical protein
VPLAVAAPLIVITFDAHDAINPSGRPVAIPMAIAPVVACVMGVSAAFRHTVGSSEAAPTVLFALTVIVPTAETLPQPPVRGML